MGSKSRRKGAQFERDVVNDLLAAGVAEARRNLGEPGGQELGVDVIAGDLRIQAKRHRNYAPISKLEEVPRRPGILPALVTRADRRPAVIALYWEDFLAMVKR